MISAQVVSRGPSGSLDCLVLAPCDPVWPGSNSMEESEFESSHRRVRAFPTHLDAASLISCKS
jgi:hypothetical protein